MADVDFRVNSPDRGGGNLNIWLAKDGAHTVGTASVYTTGRFEGLVLVIDSPAGSAGKIRGFLNDGTKDFKSQPVDGLSFGHCDYSYRNRGRPSQIKFQQTESTFKVEVDGHLCFESDSISIPSGYTLGISAASADNPDSFEVFKLVVMTDDLASSEHPQSSKESTPPPKINAQPPKDETQAKDQSEPAKVDRQPVKFTRSGMFPDQAGSAPDTPYEKDLEDEEASKITSSKAQFADLHNRLQSVNHHLATIFGMVAQSSTVGEQRHQEISVQVGEIKGLMTKLDRFLSLEDKIDQLEREMKSLHADLKSTVSHSQQSVVGQVAGHLAGHRDDLIQNLKPAGHGRLIFIIVASQLLVIVAFVVYKRRKTNSSKKYL